MNINMGGITKPIEYLHTLGDSDRRLFFFTLEFITDHIVHHGELPQINVLNELTSQKHITAYVMAFAQQQDRDTLRKMVALLQEWKPLFLAVPPGQATGHRISISGPVKKAVAAPLSGAPLIDGRSVEWKSRLKEKSSTYHSDTSGPLILNYYEARQIRAEYASRDFKSVSAERASEFPTSVEEQQKLVGQLYDAILNMDDILEKKRPTSLKKSSAGANNKSSGDVNNKESDEPAKSPKRTATDMDGEADKENAESASKPAPKSAPKPKETISVIKVKGLSRIEVEMLCWEILYTIRDVDRGQLPFMNWSGRDWGWDAQLTSFQHRFDAVATTLRRSKAAVCSLLESDYMARLAAHPIREYRRKENNRSQNAERNAQVFIGRHAIGSGQVQVGETGDLQDRDGNIVAAAGDGNNMLIEQTRLLSMAKSQDSAVKRAKTTADNGTSPTTAENTDTASPSSVATTTGSPPKANQRKPRVRNRKPTVKKTDTEPVASSPKLDDSMTTTPMVVDTVVDTATVPTNTPNNAAATANTGQVSSAPGPSTPLSSPLGDIGTAASTATPLSTFPTTTPESTSWVSAYQNWMVNGQLGLLGATDAANFSPGSGSDNSVFVPQFPSVVSNFTLLNTAANLDPLPLGNTGANTFTLPIRTAPSANMAATAANAQPLATIPTACVPSQDSPVMVAQAPMDDIFAMDPISSTNTIVGGTAASNAASTNIVPPLITDEQINLFYLMQQYNTSVNQSLPGSSFGNNTSFGSEPDYTQSIVDNLGLDITMYGISADLWASDSDNEANIFGNCSNHSANGFN